MNKILFIVGSIAAMFGLGYFFIKPSFKVEKIDGITQKITFSFDGKSQVYESGIGLDYSSSSRTYSLSITDEVLTVAGIAISGNIAVKITQFGNVVQTYNIKPIDYGFYLWQWKKN